MNSTYVTELNSTSVGEQRGKLILTFAVAVSLPLLMAFPSVSGWLAGLMSIAGLGILVKQRDLIRMDWHFIAVCLILPCTYLLNMLMTGWMPAYLDRPSHLIIGLMIFFLIGHYGLHRDALFWGACAATFIAFCITIFESVYLGNERVFGLGNRWNAVPFGNFSLLLGFFCLCGSLNAESSKRKAIGRLFLGVAGFACGLGASLLSGSRGGWLAFPFLAILYLSCNTKLTRRTRALALILLMVFTLAIYAGSDRMRHRLDLAQKEVSGYVLNPDDPNMRSTSTGIRLAMWQWGITKFLEHPVSGIGYATFLKEREIAVKTSALPTEFERLDNVHNELISALALGGIPAGAALIGFWILGWRFFYIWLKNSRNDDEYFFAMCGLVTILGTGIFSMTEGLFGTSPGTKALLLTLAIPAGALRYYYQRRNQAAKKQSELAT